MKLNLKKKNKGFNLIELMISLAIMSILIGAAAPSFAMWMANLRVRSVAEGLNLGILQARSEAIRKNQLIKFNVNLGTTGWQILDESGSVLNSKNAKEGSTGVTITSSSGGNIITFNGLGGVINNVDGSASIQTLSVNSPQAANLTQTLNVVVGSGGATLVCDPTVTNTSDVKFCRTL